MRARRPSRAHPEDDSARAIWTWAQHVPELRRHLYHIPNGGARGAIEAARMKGMGVRAGVSDYHLPLARGGYIGLWAELKAQEPDDSPVTDLQREWLDKMRCAGHAAYVCKGFLQFKRVAEWYLSLPATHATLEQPDLGALLHD